MDILEASATKLSMEIKSGAIGVMEAFQVFADNIESSLQRYNALVDWDRDLVEIEAEKAAARVAVKSKCPNENLLLAGCPVVVKDNIATERLKTTAASKMLASFVAGYNATVVKNIEDHGGYVIGKANMDEFAMGSTSEHSYFGAVKNPINQNYVAGGSSGGAAASVALRYAPFSLGSDTGGSIRQPASFCGVYGLKPTYGAVSRYGLIAYASSFDQIGPLAKHPTDLSVALEVISSQDRRDATSVPLPPVDDGNKSFMNLKNLRLAVLEGPETVKINLEVADLFEEFLGLLRREKVNLFGKEFTKLRFCTPAYYIIATAEASANLARYDGIRFGSRAGDAKSIADVYLGTRDACFGEEVKQRIMLGCFGLSAGYYESYYRKAVKVRVLVRQWLESLLKDNDFVLTPTSPVLPYHQGVTDCNSVDRYREDVYTTLANLSGFPAMSIPCGRTADGLPFGVQLIGPKNSDRKLIRVAELIEDVLGRDDG